MIKDLEGEVEADVGSAPVFDLHDMHDDEWQQLANMSPLVLPQTSPTSPASGTKRNLAGQVVKVQGLDWVVL